MFLGTCNRLDAAALSGGGWAEISNVQNRKLYSVARSSDASAASTQFFVNLGSAQPIKCLSLHAHNLTWSAAVTLKAGTLAGGDDILSSTGNAAYSIVFDSSRTFSTHYDVIIDADVAAQYWTVEIDDVSNPAGFVEIGRVGLWQGLEPEYNMSWGVQYGINDNMSSIERSIAGDFLYSQHAKKRTARFALDWLNDNERDQAHEISRVIGKTGEVLLYVGDQRYNMLGRLEQPPVLQRRFLNVNSTEIKVIEL